MNSEKNNSKAIIIGFGLVLAVVILMFSKFEIKKNTLEKEKAQKTEASLKEINNAKSISPQELLQRIQNKEKINIIDIRSDINFTNEHIPNSVNISKELLIDKLDQLEKSVIYVLVDDTDNLEVVSLAGSDFPKKGIINTYYLKGGFAKWRDDFYPTISGGDPYSAVDQAKVNYINSDQLKDLIEKEKKLLIIDVRDQKSYEQERIPGSKNIYFEDIEKRIDEIPLVRKIIVYDNDSFLAFKAAVRLYDLGKLNVSTLSDGFLKWKEKNYPVEKP